MYVYLEVRNEVYLLQSLKYEPNGTVIIVNGNIVLEYESDVVCKKIHEDFISALESELSICSIIKDGSFHKEHITQRRGNIKDDITKASFKR